MGERTAIEWTDATWNPIRARRRDTGKIGWHCEHVSEGCRNCYAGSINRRLGTQLDFKPGDLFREDSVGDANGNAKVFIDEKVLVKPLQWRRPRMIFLGSMTDIFADFVTDRMLDDVIAVMAGSVRRGPCHRFQILTKRPDRMRSYLSDPALPTRLARAWCCIGRATTTGWTCEAWNVKSEASTPRLWPLPNVWLGTSCENQATADERVPALLATPAAVRFVSAEPLLGQIDFTSLRCPNGCRPPDYCNRCCPDGREPTGTYDALSDGGLDWIIAGGESGPNARPMHPDWARVIRDQCASVGVAFLFKQWGEWGQYRSDLVRVGSPIATRAGYRPAEIRVGGLPMLRYGKQAAGRLLDGLEHNDFPARGLA